MGRARGRTSGEPFALFPSRNVTGDAPADSPQKVSVPSNRESSLRARPSRFPASPSQEAAVVQSARRAGGALVDGGNVGSQAPGRARARPLGLRVSEESPRGDEGGVSAAARERSRRTRAVAVQRLFAPPNPSALAFVDAPVAPPRISPCVPGRRCGPRWRATGGGPRSCWTRRTIETR